MSGAVVLKEQFFKYTGRKLDFIWEEAGVSLHFPAATLTKSIDMSVVVVANVSDHSILPREYWFMPAASATYKITASATMPALVTVRIQHCVHDDLPTFMVAKEGPPYYFEPLSGGLFSLTYGEIKIKTFSFLRLLNKLRNRRRIRQIPLSIQVFYHRDSTATFAVTKNLEAHITAVKQTMEYTDMEDTRTSCKSTTDAIVLSLPQNSNGWCVTSPFTPAEIKIQDVIMYEPGQTCPKIKLCMEGGEYATRVRIPISGGQITSYDVQCRPKPAQSPIRNYSQEISQAGSTTNPPHHSDRPTFPLFQRLPTRSGDIKIIERITKIHDLGINLLSDNDGAITGSIEAEHRPDQNRITKAILQNGWRELGGHHNPGPLSLLY